MTTPDDDAAAGPWPAAGSAGEWWSGEPPTSDGADPDARPSPDATADLGGKGAMPRTPRPFDMTLRRAARPRPGANVTTAPAETPPSAVDDPPLTTVDEPLAAGRTGPYDQPPRVRSTPPRKPAPVRTPRVLPPIVRRTPLPPPAHAFPPAPTDPPADLSDTDELFDPDFGLLPAPVSAPVRAARTLLLPRLLVAPARTTGVATPKRPRSPWFAMPALVLLMLLAAFLGWVSAEPFWLSVGHGASGTVTVLTSGSVCRGSFTSAAFTVSTVEIAGLVGGGCRPGAVHPARMVSSGGTDAYVASDDGLLLRWGVGFAAVLACGFALAWVLGAHRFSGWRRLIATAASLATPYVVVAALVIAAY